MQVASRDRKSPFPMITVEKAQQMVLEQCSALKLPKRVVTLDAARGKVLAQDVYSKDPLPPFPASIKDG